ncbi:MAG: ATP-dependent RNA helicase HrpA, partial [Parashewanella sp.]
KVQFGPIEPVEARDIFIRSALADGELKTKEAFFIHNRQLLEQIEELEHKSRRRDILVDEQVLVDFYKQKLPERIYSSASLFKWWKKAKQTDDKLLHFDPEMLYQRDTEHVSKLDFPDTWQQGNITLPVTYQFEPSAEDDGVSVHIPIALLNQVENTGFDWSVAGLRHEKCMALIKSLPKSLRRNFVPAPDYAKACVEAITPFDTDLISAVCKQLLRMSGVRIEKHNFDLSQIAKHLTMNFKVDDDSGKLITQGRDLEELQAALQGKVKQAIRKVADSGIEQENLESWNFGDLPKEYKQNKGQFEVKAFPALVDNKKSVAIKLFDNEHQAQISHRVGLRRLLLLNIPSPVKHLQQKLPNKAKLSMYFNPFGQVNILIEDIVAASVQQLLDAKNLDVRNADEFNSARDWVRQELNETAERIALQAEEILTCYQKIKKRLKGKISLDIAFAMSDIQTHLDKLVFKGFVEASGWQRLPDILRYLKAIENRLDKLPVDPNRDRIHMHSINNVEKALAAKIAKLPKLAAIPEELEHARWMIEEYRVSCFAQVLGTKFPISEKRILNQLSNV